MSAIRFRDIRLTAKNADSTLLDVRTYPDYSSRFALIDDHGVARSAFDKISKKSSAVRMKAGEDCNLTLMLDTRDGYHRR